MATSYGALCSGFSITQKLTTTMNLPAQREPVLSFFERLRKQRPTLERFKRYDGELALESRALPGAGGSAGIEAEEWVALRRRSVRSGAVNPRSLTGGAGAYALHRLVLETSPFYLGINPLDVEQLEVAFAFELEAAGNHNRIVAEALLGDSPLARFAELEDAEPIDIQPVLGMAFGRSLDTEAFLELKTKAGPQAARAAMPSFDRFGDDDTIEFDASASFDDDAEDSDDEPITVFLTLRRRGPLKSIDDLPAWLHALTERAETITDEKILPLIVQPLRKAIASSRA